MKKRIQVSLDPDLVNCAKAMMKLNKHGNNFSGYLEHLIRQEWSRKGDVAGAMMVDSTPASGTSRLNDPTAKYRTGK